MDPGETVPITELLDERRFLLDVAYWMLGSPAAAEGVVDQTYRRWYELSDAERHRIAVPRSWLARTAGGMCLDRLAPAGPGATGHEDDARRRPAGAEEGAGRVVPNVLGSLSSAERATFVRTASLLNPAAG
ncbi:sigma factor [Streptomyces shenzhenensis]|uniref:sigma factor n=1 Tax=Streptomyces shenzhenensis TaxID=943815 RepID=UPI0015F0AC37|nr:sigma factor [Streptomyces shenzhenensis]